MIEKICVIMFLFLLCATPIALSQQDFQIPRAQTLLTEYLPGDFVHLTVQAPLDTVQLSAVMPDGKSIDLVQARGSNVWHGLWQVPINFKKGSYSAELNAVDTVGEVFSGQTDPFTIGEIAIISLTRKETGEAEREVSLAQKIAVETPAKPGEPEQKVVEKFELPPGALKPQEKKALLERNLLRGKAMFAEGKFSEAVPYFRVALYLEPANKEAGKYFLDSQMQVKEEDRRQTIYNRLIAVGLVAVLFFLAVLSFLIYRISYATKVKGEGLPEIPKTLPEKEQSWYQKVNCKKYPFSEDVLKKTYIPDKPLGTEGLREFIKKHIEDACSRMEDVFTDAALDLIGEYSRGKARDALRICDWAARQTINRDGGKVTAEIVREYASLAFRKILIVDDEDVVCKTIEVILKNGGGYETDFAADGEEALEKINENVYGLILLDILIPKIDGYEVLKKIREKHPDLPVIFISGKGEAGKIMESLSNDRLTGLIEKPFTPEKILDAVANNLAGRKICSF